jgi:glyoxylate/hydroxypyruvate reductase A
LFAHPAITLTPHISGMTQVRSAAKLIAENVRRLRSGEAPFPVLDRTRGY